MSASHQTVATLEEFKALKGQASRKAAWARDGVNKPERFVIEIPSVDALKKTLTLIEDLGVGLVGGASLNLAVDFESKIDAKILALSLAQMQATSAAPQGVRKKSLILPAGKALEQVWVSEIEEVQGVTDVNISQIGLKVTFTPDCDWEEVLAVWNRLIS